MLFFYYLCLKITTWAFPYASVDIYNVDIYIIMRNYIRLILANIAVLTVTAQTATYYDTTSGVSHWVVSDILQDRQGFIWLSTWNGLNRFDGYEFRQVKASPGDGTGITSSVIRQIWSDARGDIVCRTDNGVFMLDMRNYKLRDVAAASVRSSRQTSAALTDREGNRWSIGRYGVTKTSPVHHPATIVSGTEGVQARAFMTDDTGHWWLATKEDKCIRVYDGSNTLTGYLGSDGRLHREKTPFGESAYAIMRTSRGDVWVGCKPGALLRLRKRADGAYHVERMNMKGLTNDVVYHLAEDNKGRLWVATFGGGVQCIVNPHDDKPRCVNYVKDKAFAGEAAYVRRVLITRGGQIVCATRGGLVVGDIGHADASRVSFRSIVRDGKRYGSLCGNDVMDVVEDGRGNVFIATENDGVDMIAGKNLTAGQPVFKHFLTSTSSLTSDACIAMTVKGDGHIMIVSTDRVMDFSPYADSTVTYSRKFWDERCHFSEERPLRLPSGAWVFGTEQGAYIATTHNMETRGYQPPLVFTELQVGGGMADIGVSVRDTVTLEAAERSFTIRYAALDYTDNSGILYRTRLDDGAWSRATADRSVSFYNLPPGEYTLYVQSTDRYGRWIDNTRRMVIVVRPYWYETLWARIVAWLLVIGIVAGAVTTVGHIRRLHRQRRELLDSYMELLAGTTSQSAVAEPSEEPLAAALPATLSADDRRFLDKVREYIEQNIGNSDASIEDMASYSATSRSSLNRKLRSLVGITAGQLLIDARMQRAHQLITSPADDVLRDVAQVAYQCGYSDSRYFSRCYKQRYGVTPAEALRQ